jgi:DNA-binding LytR/AlgR family response regulator
MQDGEVPLKIRIIASKEHYDTYKSMLETAGFEVTEEASLLFSEAFAWKDSLLGEKNDAFEIVPIVKIVLIESFGRTMTLHTANDSYEIRERLYELDQILDGSRFQRINKSQIVSKGGIAKIKPDLSGRIALIMKNNATVFVSRSYRRAFQRFIGF